MEIKSRGASFCNRWACHCLSCRQPSDQLQGPPRFMTDAKAGIGARGPAKTCSKLHFHSLHDTRPRGDSRGILGETRRVVDLRSIAKIQWPWCFWPMNHGVASLEACDHCREEPRPSIFVCNILGRVDFPHFSH